MMKPIKPSPFKRFLLPGFLSLLIIYFAYHALSGERGFFSYVTLKGQLVEAEEKLESLETQKNRLEHRVKLMHPANPDPDMLDEQVRRSLGYANQQDVIILKIDEKNSADDEN